MVDQVARIDVTADDNVSAAMNAATASLNKAADAADNVTASVERVGRSAESYVRQNDAVTKATAALAKALSEQTAAAKAFAAAMDQGKGDAEAFARATETLDTKVAAARARLAEAKATTSDLSTTATAGNAVLAQAAAAHDAQAKSARGGAMALRDLAMQGQDLFVQIASGGNIMTAFIQQGSQVAQQMMAAGQGFGALGAAARIALGAILSPIGLVITGVTALVGGFGILTSASNASARQFAELQQALRGTHDDYVALAKSVEDTAQRVSASSGLGFTEALATAKTIAQGRYFSGTATDLETLTRAAADLGAVMGGGAADGAKALADAIENPTAAAEKLAPVLSKTLTPEIQRQIDLLQKAGDQNKAFAVLLGAVTGATAGAARDGLSPMAKAWQDLGNAFTDSTKGWEPFMSWLSNTAAAILDKIAGAVRGLREAWVALGNIPQMIRSQAASGGVDNDGMPVGSFSGQAVPGGTLTASATKDAFVATWLDAARQAGQQLGVSPNIILGQWGMESGWGKSVYNNNVGNIKPGAGYTGDTFTNPGDGQAYRSYPNPAAFAADFVEQIKRNWPQAVNTGTDASAYAGGLQNGRLGAYATDPAYASKLAGSAAGLGLDAGAVSNSKALADNFASITKSTVEIKAQDLQAELDRIHKSMDSVAASSGTTSSEYQALKEAEAGLIGQIYNNTDAMTKAQRQSESSLRSTAGLTAAEQSLSAAIEARRQVALNAGQPFGSAEESQAVAAVLAAQSQEYQRVTYEMANASAQQGELATAYGKGNQAVIDLTAQQAAYNEALKLFPAGTAQFAAAFRELQDYYKQAALEAGLAKTAQQNLASNDNLAYIQTETATLGQNEAARTRLLAVMQAEQEMHRQFGDVLPAEAQKYIELKGRISDATAEFQHQQATLNEVSGFFTSTFDTISSAITQAFATGSLQALKFGDIAKSVVSAVVAEFAKLALLNPLKNLLFGSNSTTLSDVGGLLGKLVGGSDSTGVGGASTATAAGVSALESLGFVNSLSGNTPAQLADGANGKSNGVVSGLIEKAFGTGVGQTISGVGTWLASQVGSVVSSIPGVGMAATNSALAAAGEGVYGVATTAQVGTAAISAVSNAIPYIGAAITVLTSVLQGNYLSAGTTLAGAAIGTAILPGVGTAIGAALGSVLGGLLGGHAKNPYQDVALDVQDGRLTAGKAVGQLENVDGTKAGLQTWADQLNSYFDAVGVTITNANGTIGHIGDNIKGLAQTTDPNALFGNLRFADKTGDGSNFSIAKGGLSGMSFADPAALQTELAKIAGFADAASLIGIQLKSVGQDLTSIQIASVKQGGTNTTTVKDAAGQDVTFNSNLRVALQNDLVGKTFANVQALDDEISSVQTFLTSTLPGLLTPQRVVASSVQDQVQASNDNYAAAMAKDQAMGLGNNAALTAARDQAIAIIMKPALDALWTSMTATAGRGSTLLYGQAGGAAGAATMANLAQQQNNDRSSLYDTIHQTFGYNQVATDNYNRALQQLIATQNAETAATQRQVQLTKDQSAASLTSLEADYAKRAGMSDDAASLAAQDAKAAVERDQFIQAWDDYYGQASEASKAFQDALTTVDAAHYKERLALQQQFVNGQSVIDRNNAGAVVTSLTAYARGLQTSSASPLSAQDQFSLASSQFNAVAGTAAAGDYGSMQQLQTYADSLLSTARNLYGSGADYAAVFNKVVDALDNVASTSGDTLTASYMASIAQAQTDQLVTELRALKDEVAALRTETQQGNSAPARVAA